MCNQHQHSGEREGREREREGERERGREKRFFWKNSFQIILVGSDEILTREAFFFLEIVKSGNVSEMTLALGSVVSTQPGPFPSSPHLSPFRPSSQSLGQWDTASKANVRIPIPEASPHTQYTEQQRVRRPHKAQSVLLFGISRTRERNAESDNSLSIKGGLLP